MQLYYILSLKYSPRDNRAVWYKKDGEGYTNDLSKAGVFASDTVTKSPSWLNNGKTTRAIKKEDVEQMATLSVQWSDAQRF